ncbi:hypothetical protein SAMN05892883_0162 [Jatrophihabitans sp. GAS493]|uniref:hypothetical protein n=1 Tax=Jatrophihabitans sp. GAS493 TaxID=1907575 RepID=UPI000BB9A906|nr:hypothetical protein [Jatrophihabitans sp. GAS493]SOD70465.1 hypothetical protein SAMN05892883_0162 [Jatrophihabitans sp. GAS493]
MQPVDAPALHRYDQQLQRNSATLRGRAGELRRLAELPRWESMAARLYADLVHTEARLLAGCADRLLDAAEILRRHTDTALRREAELAAVARAAAEAAEGAASAVGEAARSAVRRAGGLLP